MRQLRRGAGVARIPLARAPAGPGSASPHAIPTWRKALFAALCLCAALAAAEFALRLVVPPDQQLRGTYPSVDAFLHILRLEAAKPRYDRPEGTLPACNGPQVFVRVADGTPGSRHTPTPYVQSYRVVDPAVLPAGRRVLLLGGSAAFGEGVAFEDTLGRRLEQRLRRRTGETTWQVINAARPGWELNSVALLARYLLRSLDRPPEAVVIYSGNNEYIVNLLDSVTWAPQRSLAVYRLLERAFRRNGWLRKPRELDPDAFRAASFGPADPEQLLARVWQPGFGLENAAYWPPARRIVLENYEQRLTALVAHLRQRGVRVVVVPPPINLGYFVGATWPQPVTFEDIPKNAYLARVMRFSRALLRGDHDTLQEMLEADPGSALLHYTRATHLEAKGRHAESIRHYTQARDTMMGVLSALPAMAHIAARLAGPGVAVVDTRHWYPEDRPVGPRARELFGDVCHLTPLGNALLAEAVDQALAGLSKAPPEVRSGFHRRPCEQRPQCPVTVTAPEPSHLRAGCCHHPFLGALEGLARRHGDTALGLCHRPEIRSLSVQLF